MESLLQHKTCPVCKKQFMPTRRDQIYCKNNGNKCRNSFNNNKAAGFRNTIKPVHERLISNRKVLERILVPANERVFSSEYLKGAGFDFGYYTHNKSLNNKEVVHMVFDYGVSLIEAGKYKVAYYGKNN